MENVSLVVNQSINQTAPSGLDVPLSYAHNTLFPRIADLILAPAEHPDMLWTLGPMIIALVLMQLYFGRNKAEALGWNTAFGNSIALVFISVSLLRGLFISSGNADIFVFLNSMLALSDIKILIVLGLFAYGLLLATISFFHWIPESVAFFIMNGISINMTAYVAIVIVNSDNIPLDWHTVFAGVLIFLAVYVVSMAFRFFVPASVQARIKLLERRQGLLESEVAVFERKAREARSDARKVKFTRLSRKYRQRADALKEAIKTLEAELD